MVELLFTGATGRIHARAMSKYLDDGAEVSGDDSGDEADDVENDAPTAEDFDFIDDEDIENESQFNHASVDQTLEMNEENEDPDVQMAEAIAAVGQGSSICPACAKPHSKRAHAVWCPNRVRSIALKRKKAGAGRNTNKKRALSGKHSDMRGIGGDMDIDGEGEIDGVDGADGADDADGSNDGPQDILRKLHPSTYIERYSSVFSPYPLCYMNKPQDAKRIASMNWMQSKITERMNSFVENPGAQDDLLWRVSRPMRAFPSCGMMF